MQSFILKYYFSIFSLIGSFIIIRIREYVPELTHEYDKSKHRRGCALVAKEEPDQRGGADTGQVQV